MPLYEYECDACKKRFERIQKFSDPPPDACPHCGGRSVTKLFSSPAIQFKGSGFYITDYPKKSSSEAGGKSSSSGGGDSSPAGSTESKATETKSTDASTKAPEKKS